jgi:hypothetical protein
MRGILFLRSKLLPLLLLRIPDRAMIASTRGRVERVAQVDIDQRSARLKTGTRQVMRPSRQAA